MNLIVVEPHEVTSEGDVTLADARAAHIVGVLRAASGQMVRVGMLDGPLGAGTVTSVANGTVTLRCRFDGTPPPIPPVDLLLALPRPKVLRRLWAQLAALGIGRIMLTNAERVERNYFDTHVLAPETYRPLLIEGLQQARDTRLPRVSVHRQFRILIEDELDSLTDATTRLVADPRAETSIAHALEAPHPNRAGEAGRAGGVAPPASLAASNGRVLLAVGPEGGWNAFELQLLERHRFQPVGMGARTLRTDTACVALLTLVHQALQPR